MGGALVGGGFGAAAVSVWDKINDTKADIQKVESTVQEAKAGIYKDISDAARGVTQEIGGVAKDVAGVGKEILNNRFATERGLCDLSYKTNSDIRDSRDQMGAGFNRVMDRLCNREHYQPSGCSSEDYWRYYNGITNCHTRMLRKEYIYQGCTPFFVLTT